MTERIINCLRSLYNPVWRWKRNAKYAFRSELSVKRDGETFTFDISDGYSQDWFLPRYAEGDAHEPPLTSLLIDELSTEGKFFDVGAHVGYFSGVAATVCEEVHAFEINPALAGTISRNIELNDAAGVHEVVCAAVSEYSGRVVGFVAEIPDNPSTATVADRGEVRVTSISLDDYCEQIDKYPTVLKVDVEGHEIAVLRGAEQILSKATTETVMVEVHPKILKRNGQEVTDILKLLKAAEFECVILEHRENRAGLTSLSDLSDYEEPFYLIGQ